MAEINPIKYTSRTFEAFLNDINSDNELIDKPNWWKRGIAGIGDNASLWINAIVNDLLLRTNYTRKNLQLLLELIDYYLSSQSTASGDVIFYVKGSSSFPFTVQKEDLVGLTKGTSTLTSKRYEARSNVTVTAVTENFLTSAVNTTDDEITVVREFTTGEKVRFTTTDTLPAPLSIDTDYYVIKIDATTIQLATSLTNAYAGTCIDLTSAGVGTHTVHMYSFITTMYQQESKDEYIIGESDGVTGFQEFDLADINVLPDTIEVTINSLSWILVDTFVDSILTDKHFRIFFNNDNSSFIQFGGGADNNDFGAIPPAFDIYINYAVGGGAESNVNIINRLNIYAGSDSNIDGISNPGVLIGGSDRETSASAKILAPLLLKARNRFVTEEDGEALAVAYDGITLARAIPNFYGILSTKVVCIAVGGGNPNSTLQTNLQQYLIDRSVLKSIDVRVEDSVITTHNVVSDAKLLAGYTWSGDVENYYRLAWKLFLSEIGQEIKDDYDSNGIESAVELINDYFTEDFDKNDYNSIVGLLDNLEPRQIGENIQEDDAVLYIRGNVDGLDYITITLPAFPIANDEDEITTYGSITIGEI